MSHLSGIRHYSKQKPSNDKSNNKSDTEEKEMYLNKKFKSTKDALNIFINDELFYEPGYSLI
jgi:hypothetical protein